MNKGTVLFAVILVSVMFFGCENEAKTQTAKLEQGPIDRESRMQWWLDAKFGMFIHWGIYSIPAGEFEGRHTDSYAEWIQCHLDIPREKYDDFARQFDPVSYDPVQWVRIAKEAGIKYIVHTSKHHDGFCMFDSEYTEYDVVDATPYGKDLIGPLAEACRKEGMPFGVYYSILDWHHPAQMLNTETEGGARYAKNMIKEGRKQEYIEYMKNQCRELIQKYNVEILWFDGEWVDWWTKEDGRDLEEYVLNLKPDIIINNRVGKREVDDGDFGTPEQEIPDTGLDHYWETCMTINDTWGFDKTDFNWKSGRVMLEKLVEVTSKGGNFLLNVGPTARGEIPLASVERLMDMGQWLDVNGRAIYSSEASPFISADWGRYTYKNGRVYVFVYKVPGDGLLEIPSGNFRYTSADLLTRAGKFTLEMTGDGTVYNVQMPTDLSGEQIYVIELETR